MLVVVQRIKLIVILVWIVLVDLHVGILRGRCLLQRRLMLVGSLVESVGLVRCACPAIETPLVLLHR